MLAIREEEGRARLHGREARVELDRLDGVLQRHQLLLHFVLLLTPRISQLDPQLVLLEAGHLELDLLHTQIAASHFDLGGRRRHLRRLAILARRDPGVLEAGGRGVHVAHL